jgi:hypothetical protein
MRERLIKYSISMALRTVCFVMAFVVTGWLQWVFIAGAVLLPYVAVLIANAGREQAQPQPDTLIGHTPRTALGAEPASRPSQPEAAEPAAERTAPRPASEEVIRLVSRDVVVHRQ